MARKKKAKPARRANGKQKRASTTKKRARPSPATRETESSSVLSGDMKSLITRAWFNRES